MTNDAARADDVQSAWCAEAARIEFLLQRDGAAATRLWIRRTLEIYRRAVLDRRNFAHSAEYRAKFIVSCLRFRRWLAENGEYGRQGAASPSSLS